MCVCGIFIRVGAGPPVRKKDKFGQHLSTSIVIAHTNEPAGVATTGVTFPPMTRVTVSVTQVHSTLIKNKTKFSSYIGNKQMGSGAKSYMRKGFLIYEEMHKYFHHILGGRYSHM